MFTRTFFNDLNQVHSVFSSKVIIKKFPKNSTAPNLLSASDMAMKLLSCKNLMRVFQNGPNKFYSVWSSENIAETQFHIVSFDWKSLMTWAKSRKLPTATLPLPLLNSFIAEVPMILYGNQSIKLLYKSMVLFLYDRDLRHERVNVNILV